MSSMCSVHVLHMTADPVELNEQVVYCNVMLHERPLVSDSKATPSQWWHNLLRLLRMLTSSLKTCSRIYYHLGRFAMQTQADMIVMLACHLQVCYASWNWRAYVLLCANHTSINAAQDHNSTVPVVDQQVTKRHKTTAQHGGSPAAAVGPPRPEQVCDGEVMFVPSQWVFSIGLHWPWHICLSVLYCCCKRYSKGVQRVGQIVSVWPSRVTVLCGACRMRHC